MDTRAIKQACSYGGRTWLGAHRAGLALLRLHPRLRPHIVGAQTDVCIEGFPRSANSLAVHAFHTTNPEARIAHHVHVPMQLVRAAQLGVPCAVLIRDPLDAIASLLIMSERTLPSWMAIRGYASFYRRVGGLRRQVVLVSFPDVISDPFVVARRLNQRFDTGFQVPSPDGEAKKRALESLRRANLQGDRRESALTMPARGKDEQKPRLLAQLRAEPRLAELRSLHDSLVA